MHIKLEQIDKNYDASKKPQKYRLNLTTENGSIAINLTDGDVKAIVDTYRYYTDMHPDAIQNRKYMINH